jgi:hypothetical protein
MKKCYLFITWFSFILFAACEKENENETKISQNYSDESHNFGQNCMSCHVSGGSGEGWFTVAGSLFDYMQTNPYSNGSVKFTTLPNGTGLPVKTIEVDSKGNFYTTEEMDFGNGLFVGVFGRNGEEKFMNAKITDGACINCHGLSTEKIWIE